MHATILGRKTLMAHFAKQYIDRLRTSCGNANVPRILQKPLTVLVVVETPGR